MANEKTPRREQAEQLAKLIENADRFLESAEQRVGRNYQPVTIPLSWLFRRDSKPIHLVYKLAKDASFRGSSRLSTLFPVHESFDVLEYTGLVRSRSEITNVAGWPGMITLKEYRPARLEGRQVRPIGNDRLFSLTISTFDSEGKHSYDREHFEFTPNEGMFTHYPVGLYAKTLLALSGNTDPVLRAEMWLAGNNPDETTV